MTVSQKYLTFDEVIVAHLKNCTNTLPSLYQSYKLKKFVVCHSEAAIAVFFSGSFFNNYVVTMIYLQIVIRRWRFIANDSRYCPSYIFNPTWATVSWGFQSYICTLLVVFFELIVIMHLLTYFVSLTLFKSTFTVSVLKLSFSLHASKTLDLASASNVPLQPGWTSPRSLIL